MSTIISLQFTIFSLILVGFIAKRIGLVSEAGQKNLTDLVLYIILPCNILDAFAKGASRDELGTYLTIFLIAAAIQVISVIYGKRVFRNHSEGHRKCLEYATLCSNAGFIGNPVTEGLFGAEGLALASVYLIPLRIMMWSSGLAVFSGSHDRKATVKKVVTHPCILSCILGIVLKLLGLQLPSLIMEPVRALGKCNTALSMLVIGMILERIDLKHFLDKTVFIYCLHRLVLLPALIWLLLRPLPISHTVFSICVLLTAMPAGATTSILAEKYGMEAEFATKLVIVSTLLSLPSICIWSIILL